MTTRNHVIISGGQKRQWTWATAPWHRAAAAGLAREEIPFRKVTAALAGEPSDTAGGRAASAQMRAGLTGDVCLKAWGGVCMSPFSPSGD